MIDLDNFKPSEVQFLDDSKKPKPISLKFDPENKHTKEEIINK